MVVQKIKEFLKWITPYGVVELSRNIRRDYKYSKLYLKYKDPNALLALGKNRILKDIHKNQRCFILGTGPSINKIDINKLKNEKCIFLSQFYFHKDYPNINPVYHLFSGLSPHPDIPYQSGLKFFKQIEDHVATGTLLFMNYLDKKFIEDNGLFAKHKVHYFYFKKNLNDIFKSGVDAAQVLYGAQGIPVMAIQIALYMGFKEIYLLGIDGCNDKETKASHFYDRQKSVVDGLRVEPADVLSDFYKLGTELHAFLSLMEEFRLLRKFIEKNDCKIYNATSGGVIEVFDRVDFDSVF
jgi:hypothetical protein